MKKVVLITGASSGLGKATAEYLAAKGLKVYGVSRSAHPSQHFEVLSVDVNDRESVEDCVQEILRREGRIDIVVNNAGFSLAKPLEDLTEEELRSILNTNLYGAMRVCQATLPSMQAQGQGLIINVSSLAGLFAVPFNGAYSISKFALEAYSEGLYMEMKRYGVEVSVVNPGSIKTNIIKHQKTFSTEEQNQMRSDFARFAQKRQQDQSGGLPTSAFAEQIYRIIKTQKRKFRYLVAQRKQRFAYWIKRYFSFKTFARSFMSYYGMEQKA